MICAIYIFTVKFQNIILSSKTILGQFHLFLLNIDQNRTFSYETFHQHCDSYRLLILHQYL